MRFVNYREHDAERVAAFYERVHARDPHVGTTTADAFRRYAELERNLGGRDFELAEVGQDVVGLLLSACPPGISRREVRVVVHPDYRRAGLGRSLIERACRQAPARELMASVRGEADSAVRFAEALGFEVIARRVRMRLQPNGAARAARGAQAQNGFRLRPGLPTSEDDASWQRLERCGFSGLPGYSQSTLEDLRVLRAAPGFRLTFAQEGERVVGMCHSTRFWGNGHAELLSLVVEPGARRRGIGRALVGDAIAQQLAAGAEALELVTEVDNPARELYAAFGFDVTANLLTYAGPKAAPHATTPAS